MAFDINPFTGRLDKTGPAPTPSFITSVADTPTVDLDVTWGVLTATATISKYTPAGTIANANTNPAFPVTPTVGDAREITTTQWTVWWLPVTPWDLLVYGLSGWFVLQWDDAIRASVADLPSLTAITNDPIGMIRLVRSSGISFRWNGIVRQALWTNETALTNNLGSWNANTNTPAITSWVWTAGDFYTVSVAGTTTIDGISTRWVWDYIWFEWSSNTRQKIDNQWGNVPWGADVVYLASNGNNTTAIVGREDRPFATPQNAISACPNGGTIVVKGKFVITATLNFSGKSDIKFLVYPWSQISTTNGAIFLISTLGSFNIQFEWMDKRWQFYGGTPFLLNSWSGVGGCIDYFATSSRMAFRGITMQSATQRAVSVRFGTPTIWARSNTTIICTGWMAREAVVWWWPDYAPMYWSFDNCTFYSTVADAVMRGNRQDGFRCINCLFRSDNGRGLYLRRNMGTYQNCTFRGTTAWLEIAQWYTDGWVAANINALYNCIFTSTIGNGIIFSGASSLRRAQIINAIIHAAWTNSISCTVPAWSLRALHAQNIASNKPIDTTNFTVELIDEYVNVNFTNPLFV